MGVIESTSLEFLGVVLVYSPLGGHKEYIFFSVYDMDDNDLLMLGLLVDRRKV